MNYTRATKDFLAYDTEWNDLPWFAGRSSPALEAARRADSIAEIEPVWPAPAHLYRALRLTVPDEVRVVILGQDPYHTAGAANGLAFSAEPGRKLPPSLRNIFLELQDDTGVLNSSGFLRPWAYQGVLLLNTALTVTQGRAGSHSEHWRGFARDVVQFLSKRDQPIVFILWGAHARSFVQGGFSGRHCIIQSNHPSPLSANKGGFFGTKPFSGANRYLTYNKCEPIDWRTHNGMVGPRGTEESREPFRPLQGSLSERILASRGQRGSSSDEPRERLDTSFIESLDL